MPSRAHSITCQPFLNKYFFQVFPIPGIILYGTFKWNVIFAWEVGKGKWLEVFLVIPRYQCLPAETLCYSSGAHPKLALSTQLGRWWPLTCCSGTRASISPNCRSSGGKPRAENGQGGFKDTEGVKWDLRVSSDSVPAEDRRQSGRDPRTEQLVLEHGVSKDGLALVLAPRLLEESRWMERRAMEWTPLSIRSCWIMRLAVFAKKRSHWGQEFVGGQAKKRRAIDFVYNSRDGNHVCHFQGRCSSHSQRRDDICESNWCKIWPPWGT